MFKKLRDSGIVVNNGEGFTEYLRAKESAKSLARTKKAVVEQQYEMREVKNDINEIKNLLQLLLDKKV